MQSSFLAGVNLAAQYPLTLHSSSQASLLMLLTQHQALPQIHTCRQLCYP
jgi:hypothetical protein